LPHPINWVATSPATWNMLATGKKKEPKVNTSYVVIECV